MQEDVKASRARCLRLTAVTSFLTFLALLAVSVSPSAQALGPCDAPNTCTIWPASAVPGTPAIGNDPHAVELGVKFRTAADGYITAIRFYKGTTNTGTHIVNLWTKTGTLLARATAINETASGWQEVQLPSPVAVVANTTYVASYHTNVGAYALDPGYFAFAVNNGALTALQDGADGGNGVYTYGTGTTFPSSTFQSANYWVDVVFATSLPPDTIAPQVLSTSPANGANNIAASTAVTASFSENIDPGTLSTATFEIRNPGGSVVAARLTYSSATQLATLQPNTPLVGSTTYTATLRGGADGIKDPAGNSLPSDVVWRFTTRSMTAPPATTGPGGPILVVSSATNPFTVYYAEILRGEGLNEFAVVDINAVTATTLTTYDVVIIGEQSLTPAQVTMFSDWVTAGGNLIAMRPDKQLATLLGLTNTNTVLSDGYIQVDTSAAPGTGIVGATMQFHGTADLYTLNGAASVATLYSSASGATPNPAVTVRSVGTLGGQAAAFTYDLARSVVYTRQGNPAWSGLERDGFSPIRADDLFFGGTELNYLDLSKVAIPQADEQQRLLANLIGLLNIDRKPLPRFWYFPRGLKAAVVMTGDDHATGGTAGRFDIYNSNSVPGCAVDNWECVRSTSYVYPATQIPGANAYSAQGFEIGLHPTTGCNDFDPASLETVFSEQLAQFAAAFPDLSGVGTNRTHCLVWSDYDTHPQIELTHGIRLDVNYYYWPPNWVNNVPGLFTGSGMAQRYAKVDGTILDIYQAPTQWTDESGQTFPFNADALLDRALGPEGYYGSFVANMHTDSAVHAGSAAIVDSAQRHGVPVISAQQLLNWTDGRNASSFSNFTWNGTTLSFRVNLWSGTQGIQAMVPAVSSAGSLVGILTGGVPIDYTIETIKGVGYARFFVSSGSTYQARYGVDNVGPAISALTVTPSSTSASWTWHTNEPATTKITYGISPTALVFTATVAGLDTSHAITVTGLASETTYYYRVTSADALNNSTSAPTPNGTFATGPPVPFSLVDSTAADFSAGTRDAALTIGNINDGELLLLPTAGAEFTGTSLPTGWTVTPWAPGGTANVGGGQVAVDGALLGTASSFNSGSLEFVATFSGQAFEHVGIGIDFNDPPWAFFSTREGGALYARTHNGSASTDTVIPTSLLGAPHRFRIDWTATSVVYWVDGNQVASHTIGLPQPLRLLVSDFTAGGGNVAVNWIRLSPYPTASTFESRVMDAQVSTTWGNATWTASVPAGTTLQLSARFGDTPVPDSNWTGYVALPSSGTMLSQTSRYVQYRAIFGGDGTSTPVLENIAFTSSSSGPAISVDDVNVSEGDTGTTPAVFTLRLSTPLSVPVSVSYATANDTATTADYTTTAGTATFNPGETTVTVSVPIKGDVLTEANETFFLNLSNPVNASISDPQAVCTIVENDLTLITISDAPAVVEGNAGVANATFSVALSKALQVPVTVNYASADVTATANVDYTPVAGTLTFAAGETQKAILVSVIADSLNEGNETFVVNLSNATNGTITAAQGTGTINNDDPVVSVTIGDLSVTESTGGTNTAQVPVTLSAAAGQTVSVGYTMTAGTATTADYTNATGTVTFAPGVTSQTIPINIVTDTIFETNETFTVTLRTPVNVTIARAAATVTILNDDPLPTISVGNATMTEGNTGTANANFVVTLSNPSSSTITVNYATADGTALAGVDYNTLSGSLTYTAGQTSKTVSVQVRGDTIDEPNETFTLNISGVVNATIGTAAGTATITDNDNPPSIRITDVAVTETDPGATADAVLNVTLSAPSSFPISVNYATTGGTATSNVDYNAASGTVSFAPGETSKSVTVTVLGDLINEVNETINVDLTLPVKATIADSRGVVTITENDPLPQISINDVSVTEGAAATTKPATFKVTLSRPSSRSVTVAYATGGGTATAGTDYTARSGTLTFAAGVTSVDLAITVRGDATIEPDETALVTLSSPNANGTLLRSVGTLTIQNDDQ